LTLRIGVDVGGTNTDAVLMRGSSVVAKVKTPTTEDVTTGISIALRHVLDSVQVAREQIAGVMIGTTQFTNAVVERRRLQPTAVVRLGLPATLSIPPMTEWPYDLRNTVGNHAFLCHGGYEFNGREISPFDPNEIRAVAGQIADLGVQAVAVSCVFSPVNAQLEVRASEILQGELPGVTVTRSSDIGRIGLLERENAAILNACLGQLAKETVSAFKRAIQDLDIRSPVYLTQNDGTLMSADFAEQFPVFTIASGPTNSMRGAAFLSGLKDAVVIDVGGTTSDVGALVQGFPREAAVSVEIGGVRTNFRMPDVYSFGLGGGSQVEFDLLTIGPESVGYRLTNEALVFGGRTLTATDVAVAAGRADIGNRSQVAHLARSQIDTAIKQVDSMIAAGIDRMKTSAEPVPIIVVGGGSVLIGDSIAGGSEVIRPEHFEAANAVGAAIAQISGEVDRVFSLANTSRDRAIEQAKTEASKRAVDAGAAPGTVEIVDVEDVPLTYLPGNATRIRVKAVGDLNLATSER
jgi:N-methylhydantoinase A/oxoprolinase/acetone carboxylase beta subunit